MDIKKGDTAYFKGSTLPLKVAEVTADGALVFWDGGAAYTRLDTIETR